MPKIDFEYNSIINKVLSDGKTYINKSRGITRLQIPSYTFRHSFEDGFPAVSSKKLAFKGIVGELIWFLNGDNDIKYLNENGIKIWNKDAYNAYKGRNTHIGDKALMTFEQFSKKGCGSVGQNYSVQWRNFGGEVDQIKVLIKNMKRDIMGSRLKVEAWNPMELDKTALPPCFVKETSIMTNVGSKSICDIVVGDKVLTKEGEYKEVYDKMITPYEGTLIGLDVRCRRGDIRCTPNHEFFLKDKGWVQSMFIEEGDFLGIPINKKSEIENFKYTKSKNQFTEEEVFEIDMNNKDLWWAMGFFLGDGWCRQDRYEFSFAISDEERDYVYPKLKKIFKNIKETKRRKNTGKSNRFNASGKGFSLLLREFGHLAHNKIIPEFVMNAPKEYVSIFLDGYRASDGTKTIEEYQIGTVSESLAYGTQLLLAKVGKKSSISYSNRPKYKEIQGRIVRQKDKYYVVSEYKGSPHGCEIDSEFIWYEVENVFKYNNIKTNVYNISVKDSHTYTAFNIVNHNCHTGFQIIGVPLDNGEFGFELHWNQRSVDLFLGLPFNIASYAVLAKILEKETGYKALGIEGSLKCVHLYGNSIEAAKELVSRKVIEGNVDLKIDNFTNFEELDIKDFSLVGYDSHKSIKVDMVAPREFKKNKIY